MSVEFLQDLYVHVRENHSVRSHEFVTCTELCSSYGSVLCRNSQTHFLTNEAEDTAE